MKWRMELDLGEEMLSFYTIERAVQSEAECIAAGRATLTSQALQGMGQKLVPGSVECLKGASGRCVRGRTGSKPNEVPSTIPFSINGTFEVNRAAG